MSEPSLNPPDPRDLYCFSCEKIIDQEAFWDDSVYFCWHCYTTNFSHEENAQ